MRLLSEDLKNVTNNVLIGKFLSQLFLQNLMFPLLLICHPHCWKFFLIPPFSLSFSNCPCQCFEICLFHQFIDCVSITFFSKNVNVVLIFLLLWLLIILSAINITLWTNGLLHIKVIHTCWKTICNYHFTSVHGWVYHVNKIETDKR